MKLNGQHLFVTLFLQLLLIGHIHARPQSQQGVQRQNETQLPVVLAPTSNNKGPLNNGPGTGFRTSIPPLNNATAKAAANTTSTNNATTPVQFPVVHDWPRTSLDSAGEAAQNKNELEEMIRSGHFPFNAAGYATITVSFLALVGLILGAVVYKKRQEKRRLMDDHADALFRPQNNSFTIRPLSMFRSNLVAAQKVKQPARTFTKKTMKSQRAIPSEFFPDSRLTLVKSMVSAKQAPTAKVTLLRNQNAESVTSSIYSRDGNSGFSESRSTGFKDTWRTDVSRPWMGN